MKRKHEKVRRKKTSKTGGKQKADVPVKKGVNKKA